ncbi:glycosyl transferase [Nocardia sp. NPDC058058]|uniref:glycosyl transferase n=1 Tax=Nocardia sp. NPDC058058 TaxID=3346317 RepID=UPI0036DB2A43
MRSARTDLIVAGGYLTLAVLVLSGLWAHPRSGYLIESEQDQTLYEWFFALTAHQVTHFESPFSTSLQNFPDGVNLMANTLMYGFGVPFTPVTLLFGPTVTFALALTLGLSGTAFAWYLVFSRELVTSEIAAAIAGLFCGFAPAMISHTNGHPNYVVLVLLPFIARRVIKMVRHAEAGPEAGTARDSIALGLLVAMQIALGEEPLLLFALGFAVFGLAYLRTRRAIVRTLRAIARPVLLAALITLALTGLPLPWFVFGWIPPLNGMIESRLAMAAIPAIAIILALGAQRAIDHWRATTAKWRPVAWFTALACALLPLTPTTLPVVERTPTPAFFADGTVRQYISDGSVVIVPPAAPKDAIALRWQLDSDFTFPLVGGYYVGPGADGSAHYGPMTRPTGNMLTLIRMFGAIPVIDQPARDQALADLRFWHADVVVLPPTRHADALRRAVDELLGVPAREVDGVWLWDVRTLV